jgi:hypothetical protein
LNGAHVLTSNLLLHVLLRELRLLFFLFGIIFFSFPKPPIISSTASKVLFVNCFFVFLAAIKAASLQTLAISAPENQVFVLLKV